MSSMHPAYFETRFRTPAPVASWPEAFVIVSAYATTGASWPTYENEAADRRLEAVLRSGAAENDPSIGGGAGSWLQRITGYSPKTGHAEPSWSAILPFHEACDLGLRFRQDAIYLVRGDALLVSHCDGRREPVLVGSFRERLDVPEER